MQYNIMLWQDRFGRLRKFIAFQIRVAKNKFMFWAVTAILRFVHSKGTIEAGGHWKRKGYEFDFKMERLGKQEVFTVKEILELQNYISKQPDDIRDYWMPVLAKM